MDLLVGAVPGPLVLLWALASVLTTVVVCAVLTGARRTRDRAAARGLRDPLLRALEDEQSGAVPTPRAPEQAPALVLPQG